MKTKEYISTITHIVCVVIFLTLTLTQIALTPTARASTLPAVDRDTDDDGLIEVSSLAQLNALRHDLDGDGQSTESAYNTQLGSSLTNSGCPSTCAGYELTADLDFDTNGDGRVDSGDDYYNSGSGWEPIGDGTSSFNATFHGNGHTISNLTVDRSTSHWGGLFGELGIDAVVRNLGLVDASVNAKGANQNNPGEHGVGGLAGVNRGLIYHTYTTGMITGEGAQRNVGGLVGRNIGYILASYSQAQVTGNYDIGGLVGLNDGSVIWTYATGSVRNKGFDGGGLVADQSLNAEIAYSYSTGDVTGGFSNANARGLTTDTTDGTITQSYFDSDRSNRPASDDNSKTSSQLQSPTSASGIFSDWAKAEHIIYEGTLTPNSRQGDSNTVGYKKNNFGSLSPTAIGSATIEELFHIKNKRERVYIKIKENGSKVNATDVLSGATITLKGDSTTLTSPITSIVDGGTNADILRSNIQAYSMFSMFNDENQFNISFGETIGGKDHAIDIPNLWDFGTSNDLPLLSVDFNGDGTASVSEFGEQVDQTKPVITLNGDDTITLIEGTAYTDAGATVVDPGNTSYTGTVSTTISGPDGQTSFDNTVLGDWTFTYTAPADSSGNVPDSVTRTVTITASTPTPTPNQPAAIFSATFTPGNLVHAGDGIYGHRLPSHNALTNDNGVAHNTFTLGGVTYTVNNFSYEASGNVYFEVKAGSNHVDERTVFADYSLVIVNENSETFSEEITEFENSNINFVWITLNNLDAGTDPFEYGDPWNDWSADSSINVSFSIVETSSLDSSSDTDGGGSGTGGDTSTPNQPAAIFSANFTPGNVISPSSADDIYGHQLPSHNALNNDNGDAHHTFTLGDVEYTINDFSFERSSANIYFELKSGSEHIDERTVLADYSLVIVNENDVTFTEEITDFGNSEYSNWVSLRTGNTVDPSPFKYQGVWSDWIRDDTITVDFSIVETSSLGVSLDFDGNGTFTPSQDALALYLVTQLSTNANTLSSYVHDGATETASTTITLINSLTTGTSLDFDGSETFVPSQDALALYLATQLSANANTLASYVYDRSSETAGNTITRINNLVTSTNG